MEPIPDGCLGKIPGSVINGWSRADPSDDQCKPTGTFALRKEVEARGKIYYARGEMDAEYKTYGWSTQNIPQALYWSSIYAVHCGLNIWNLPGEACAGDTYSDAIHFFNRYATQKRPEFSKVAFCALRRGLDASDTKSFPESIYGSAVKSNTQRYIDIANAFSEYGANQGDPEKATGGGMNNRQREDYNDVGWKILTTNYQLNLTQIDPDKTSIAWWQVDKSVYGRFARGFDASRGMNTMFFDVDDQYFKGNRLKDNGRLKVRIIYKAGDGGSWELLYHAKDGSMKTACNVENDVDSDWLTQEVLIDDALLDNGGPKGADLIPQNLGNTNCRFHMIELERDLVSPSNDSIKVTGIAIDNCPPELMAGSIRQLSAIVSPSNAGDQSVSWSSSNPNVAIVDGWGLLTAGSTGSADIITTSGDGLIADTCSVNVVEVLSNQSPFGGENRTIPGLIEGEDFDDGGLNISYYDTDEGLGSGLDYRPLTHVDLYTKGNGSNGLSVGRTRDGEWLEYTLNVSEDAYDITVYYYCNSTPGELELSLDGTMLATLSGFVNQGDWSIRDSVSIKGMYVPGGEGKILRLEFVNGGWFDIDAILFSTGDRIDVSGVTMNACPSNPLYTGDSQQLSASVIPMDASKRSLSWSSSDNAVARVDANGLVTAFTEGTTKITVSTDDGGFTDSCQIQVVQKIHISGVAIDNCPVDSLVLGDSYPFTASISPPNATSQNVIWSTFDASKATVNANGLVSSISEGPVIISPTAPGGFTDQCEINIYKPYVAVSSITIDGCSGTGLEKGNTRQLTAELAPSDATDQSVSWSSSDKSVATVYENGLITAISVGNATVTVTSNDGGLSDICEITVIPVSVTSVKLNNCPDTRLNVGDEHRLTAFIIPADAANQTVTWTSSDTLVATVDTEGLVTARSGGTVMIRVTTNDGGYMDGCNFTVLDTTSTNRSTQSELSLYGIKLYPNPVENTLHITFPDAKLPKRVSVFNLHGQCLARAQTFDDHLGIDLERINIQSMLLVEISHGEKKLFCKIIKN